MNQPNLPAGLDKEGRTVEIYNNKGILKADFRGERILFWELPNHIIDVYRKEMKYRKNFMRIKKLDKIINDDERLEAYVAMSYGKFDNYPDWEKGKGTINELSGDDAIKEYNICNREKEIMVMISNGLTDHDIASSLSISPYTVQNHRHNILQKTGVRNAVGLTRFTIEKRIA